MTFMDFQSWWRLLFHFYFSFNIFVSFLEFDFKCGPPKHKAGTNTGCDLNRRKRRETDERGSEAPQTVWNEDRHETDAEKGMIVEQGAKKGCWRWWTKIDVRYERHRRLSPVTTGKREHARWRASFLSHGKQHLVTSGFPQQSGHTRRVNEAWAAHYGDSLSRTPTRDVPSRLLLTSLKFTSDLFIHLFSSQRDNNANLAEMQSSYLMRNTGGISLFFCVSLLVSEWRQFPSLTPRAFQAHVWGI